MKRLAVGLIGLLAGAELRVSDLRERYRQIFWILVLQMGLVLLVLTLAALIGRPWIPFLQRLDGRPAGIRGPAVRGHAHRQLPDGHPGAPDRDRGDGPAGEDHPGRGPGRRRDRRCPLHDGIQPGAGESGGQTRTAPRRFCSGSCSRWSGRFWPGCVVGGSADPLPPFRQAGAGGVRGRAGLRHRGGGRGAAFRAAAQPPGGRLPGRECGPGPGRAAGGDAPSDGRAGVRHLLRDGRGRAARSGSSSPCGRWCSRSLCFGWGRSPSARRAGPDRRGRSRR